MAAAAQGEQGQAYINDLVEQLQASGPIEADPAAEQDAVEQAQAQARLDGYVRQVTVSRDA